MNIKKIIIISYFAVLLLSINAVIEGFLIHNNVFIYIGIIGIIFSIILLSLLLLNKMPNKYI